MGFKKGELVRIFGYMPNWDGIEGIVTQDEKQRDPRGSEVAYITVTKLPSKDTPFTIGRSAAMYFRNLERVQRPEELICEDWS